MKMILCLFLFSMSASALARTANQGAPEGPALSNEYNRREQASASAAEANAQSNFLRIIQGSVVNESGSNVASEPEIKFDKESQIGTWYYKMENRLICSVPVSYSNNGAIVYVWGNLVSCK